MKKQNYVYMGIGIIIFGILIILFSNDLIQIMRWGFPTYSAKKEGDTVLNKAIATRDIQVCNELPETRKILTSDGEIDSSKGWGTIMDCRQQFSNKITIKPIITYPKNGDTINEKSIHVTGTTNPNFEIYAYINYPANEQKCISFNSYANGGAGKADSNGNFDFILAEPCGKELTVFVASVNPEKNINDECYNQDSISEAVKFVNSGEIPTICNQ